MVLARKIKDDSIISDTRLILLTSFGKRMSPQELHASGFMDCCSKPVRQSTLFDCLASAVGQAPATVQGSPTERLPSPALAEKRLEYLLLKTIR